MKKQLIILISLIISLSSYAESCLNEMNTFEDVYNFADGVMDTVDASASSQKALGITITKFGSNKGKGDVHILENEDSTISAIKIKFVINGKVAILVKTIKEIEQGEKLEYFETSNSSHPTLVLKKANSATISKQNGGKFTFSILSEKEDTYKHYNIFLKKVNGKWIVKNEKDTSYKNLDLTPNTSFFSWDGTFSKAIFE